MIVFDLKCGEQGHVFEGWFGSTADFDSQRDRGLLACPICGSSAVEKFVNAPRLNTRGDAATEAVAYSEPAKAKAMIAAMAAAQAAALANSDYVGDRFASEARAMHAGDIEERTIHGRTTKAESERLIADGIPVAPLPFPVIAPDELN